VSQPLIALFFAIGFGNLLPNEIEIFPRRPQLRLWRYGVYCLLLTAVSFACLPWIAHQLYPAEAQVQKLLAEQKGGVLVFGGRRMTGFLVIEDGSPLRSDVPTLHLSEFKAIIEQSQVETYQGLVNPVTPPLPFGFVFTPRLERGIPSSVEYIVPAKVIERSDVEAWRFQLGPWDRKPGGQNHYWFYVTNAEPLQLWSR
jgi:hypothetical protein